MAKKRKGGKGITAKQRAARVKNMKIARSKRWNKKARKKQSASMRTQWQNVIGG